MYHRLIWGYCSSHGLPLHIGNATHIKYSFGIARGKNDKLDSQRLCSYAYKNAEELKATPVLNPVLLQLKDLMTARSRLLSQLNSIKQYLGELKLSNPKAGTASARTGAYRCPGRHQSIAENSRGTNKAVNRAGCSH